VTTGGGPMADFFDQVAPKIGITADAFRDLSGADALQLFVASLEKANLSQAEMTFYMEAMASDSTLLLPLLRDNAAEMNRLGENASSLGAIMSNETVAALDRANMAVADVSLAFQGMRNRIAAELAPALTVLASGFADAMREGGALRVATDALVNNLDVLAFSVASVTAVVGARFAAALALSTLALAKKAIQAGLTATAMRALGVATAFAGGPIGAVAALLGAGAAAAVIFGRDTDAAGGIMSDTEKAAANLGTELGILSGNDLPIATAKTVDLANANLTLARSAYAAAEAEIAKAKAAADAAWTQMSTERAFLPGVEPAGAANYEAQIAKLVAANAELSKAEAELNARVIEGNKVKADATEVMRDLNVNVRGLEDATGGAGKSLKKTKKEAEDLAKEFDGPLTSAVDSVADAFGDFFARGFRDFKSFKDSIVGGFRQMISQMISTAIANPIKIALGIGGSVAGGAAQAATGAAGGIGGLLGGVGSLAGSGGLLGAVGGIASGLGGILSGGGLSASFANLGGLLSGSVSGLGAIGAAIPAVGVIGLAIAAFRKKVTILDTGLDVAIEGVEAVVSTFTTKNTKRFFGLSSKTRTTTASAGADIADPIQDAVTAIQQSVIAAAAAFDFGADAFEGFTYDFRLSLKGLSEDAQLQAINAELGKMGDAFAAMLPAFSSMTELLEAATQRLQIEDRLLALQGRNAELLARQRERELASVHALNRPLLEQVYALEDQAVAAQAAADKLAEANAQIAAFASNSNNFATRADQTFAATSVGYRGIAAEVQSVTLLQELIRAVREGDLNNARLTTRLVQMQERAELEPTA
ncbi:MAG: hypothetical protein LPK02_10230, partial [Rhodobacterales bacterium]|nr:hypothetical protein [Rhodobacterales bacterium]